MRFDTFCLMVSMELDNMMWISISIDSGVSVSTVSASSSIDSGVQSTVEFNLDIEYCDIEYCDIEYCDIEYCDIEFDCVVREVSGYVHRNPREDL